MEEEESIKDLIQRFTTITNHLMTLGNTFDNVDLVHRILRSMIKEKQPKVISIKESLEMGVPTIQYLYENQEEHKLDLKRYEKNINENKKNSLALKAINLFDNKDEEFDETKAKYEKDEIAFISKKLQKILKKKRNRENRKIAS